MKAAATAAVLGIAVVAAVMTFRGSARRDTPGSAVGAATAPSPSAVRATRVPRAVTAAAPIARQRSGAVGGVAILASAARAQAVVAGVVSDVASIDVHGWRGALRVDSVLLGHLRLGDTVTIGWEELSSERQVRFEEGQRVLLVLDPLPTQSLWRKRFPTRDAAHEVLVVASNGEAFLPRPDGPTLAILEHYLAMTPDARDGAPGALRLAELVRDAHPAVAREALAILEAAPARMDVLGADGAASLLAAARSSERETPLRSTALRLAGQHRLPGTRETALTLAEPGSPIRADAYRVLAGLPDGLPAERVASLLDDADPEVRAVGVELVRDETARDRVVALSRDDPSPVVRLAAARALLAGYARGGDAAGSHAIADVIGMLDDPDAGVRTGVAESIGALGEPAVAPLDAAVDGDSERAALAAILGLARTGPKGAALLALIAESHENKSVRAFARLALGEAPGHAH